MHPHNMFCIVGGGVRTSMYIHPANNLLCMRINHNITFQLRVLGKKYIIMLIQSTRVMENHITTVSHV